MLHRNNTCHVTFKDFCWQLERPMLVHQIFFMTCLFIIILDIAHSLRVEYTCNFAFR
jgi:hypothetical protein